MSLSVVLEQGLRQNREQVIREKLGELYKLEWKDTKEEFWFPKIELTMTTDSQRLGRFWEGGRDHSSSTKSPSGSLSLGVTDYTVFNWGKDYLTYLNNKETNYRKRVRLNEERRELKHNLITQYFTLVTNSEILRAKRQQLRHASFLYRMNREKITLKKVAKQDYYQSRAEYLKAQTGFQQAKINVFTAEENLAYLLKDDVGTRYILSEQISFKPLKISLAESMRLSSNQSPDILEAKANVNTTKRNYDLTLKENLPLPKVTLDVGAYSHQFGPGKNRTGYRVGESSSDVELSAAINATWSLTGSGGLFNGRKTRQSLINHQVSLRREQLAIHRTHSSIRNLFQQIMSYQNLHQVLEASVPNMQKTYDVILDNYIAGKADYYDFSRALEELINAKISLIETKFYHLRDKVLLAKTIGLEDFPGENFEDLALKKVKK
jgi:outer membrane protein TolC